MFRATKIHQISPKQDTFHKNLRFFIKNLRFFLQIPKKAVPLHPHFEKCTTSLGYGVMVTLQILVLPFLVRVRVPQPKERVTQTSDSFSLIICFTLYFSVTVLLVVIF